MCAHLKTKLSAEEIQFNAVEACICCMLHTVQLAALEVLSSLT